MLNPYLIAVVLGALLVSFIGGGLLGWHEKTIRVPALLEGQQSVDQQECQKAQLITKGVNDVLQKERDDIARKLALVKLQHPATCVPVTASPKLPSTGSEYAGQNGSSLSSDWLRDFAAEGEQYRQELGSCIDFLAIERQAFVTSQ